MTTTTTIATRSRPAACGDAPDVNLVNGRFLTMDARNSVGSALAIRDGRIARVGHAGELGPCGRTMNSRVRPSSRASSTRTFISCGRRSTPATGAHHRDRGLGRRAAADDRARATESVPGRPVHHERRRLEHQRTCRSANANVAELDAAAPQHAVYLSTTGRRRRGDEQSRARVLPVPRHHRRCERRPQRGQALAALQAVQTEDDRQRGTAEVNRISPRASG